MTDFQLIVAIIAIVIFLILLKFLLKPKKLQTPPLNYFEPHADDSHESISLNQIYASFPNGESDFKKLGTSLQKNKVKQIWFVHGTFVGDDPFGVVHLLGNAMTSEENRLAKTLRKTFEKGSSFLMGDNGNFPEHYPQEFTQKLGVNIPSHRFMWSSQNHHAARLSAAYQLLRRIKSSDAHPKNIDNTLLIGHSHAGQLFALISQLIGNSVNYKTLVTCLDKLFPGEDVEGVIAAFKKTRLSFVTLGTPPRYGWSLNSRMKLVNIVNHRGPQPVAGKLSGILNTRDGDYVQQIGIAGSDIAATSAREREVNQRLDPILGIGFSRRELLENLKAKRRLPKYGYTFLVDYEDVSQVFPNFTKTCFGHGAYTNLDKIPVILYAIRERLFPHSSR